MIVIRLQGGLGNQMFQYALYRQLKKSGYQVRIDDVSGYAEDLQRRPVLTASFGISYDRADDRDIRRLRDAFMDPVSRIRRKLFGRKNREWVEPDGRFHPEVLSADEVYYDGYFQSEQYFPDGEVRRALCGEFSWDAPAALTRDLRPAGADEAAAAIDAAADRSVSLHIRRGDYLLPGPAATHGGICTEAYYERALQRMEQAVPGAHYFLFGDDLPYVQDFADRMNRGSMGVAPGERAEAVTVSDGEMRDAAELLLMSRCRHHILANSSFSWWGAWLAEHRAPAADGCQKGVTLVPDRWFNNREADAIYTENMERVLSGAGIPGDRETDEGKRETEE